MKYIGNAYAALSPVFWLLIQIMYNELVSHAVSGTWNNMVNENGLIWNLENPCAYYCPFGYLQTVWHLALYIINVLEAFRLV